MTDSPRINDLATLTAILERQSIDIRWTIYPHEPAVVWLAPSTIQLRAADTEIVETAFSHQFKQFLSNTLGLESHTRGTTLTASGSISLAREIGKRSICIEVNYSESPESPEIESYCDSGSSSIHTSLEDFEVFLDNLG